MSGRYHNARGCLPGVSGETSGHPVARPAAASGHSQSRNPMTDQTTTVLPIGQQVSLPGHFDLPVTLESARPLGKGFECRVRLHDGTLDEAVISEQEAAALVDALHRILWLMEKRPTELPAFLRDAQLNREQLRLVAHALAGPALKGGELGDVSPTAELSALGKLTANWQSVIEIAALTTAQKEEKMIGQKQLL